MARKVYVVYGVVAYLIFFATFLYLVGFLADLPQLPVTVDRGPASAIGTAIVINLLLIALFGVQHSVMARQGFKRAWTRVVPEPIERSTYVILASVVLMILFALWRPIVAPVWAVEQPLLKGLLWTLFGLGWVIVLVSTFLLNHFELFGLRQVYTNLTGRGIPAPQFHQPFFYKLVRHPLYSGFFLAFWVTPVMSAGHLLLAAGMSLYMLIAIQYEERDLIGHFGEEYETYRKNVGMLAPRLRR